MQPTIDELMIRADVALKSALAAEVRTKEATNRALTLLAKLDKLNNTCKCCGKR